MKVVLFRPRPHKETIGLQNVMICEPLELEYIASNVEQMGHEVIIVDMILEHKKIAYFLKLHAPDVVGITGYISHVNIIKEYARQVKKYDEKIPVLVGGVHAEVNPEDFDCGQIDYIIRANGLQTFMEIVRRIERNKEKEKYEKRKQEEVEEKDYQEKGKINSRDVVSKREFEKEKEHIKENELIKEKEFIEEYEKKKDGCPDTEDNREFSLDRRDIPGVYGYSGGYVKKETEFHYLYPDRDKVNKYRKKYYYMFHRNCSLIKTSYGCPYNCKFCFCRQITDDQYFTRDLDDIIAELKTIPETEIYIVDDDFLFDEKKLLKFCDLLEENDIHKKYLVYGRADFVAGHEDVIKRFKEVGLRAVIVGLESCDSKALDSYNKRTLVDTNEKAVEILRKYDVECYGTLILGLDWTWDDFNALAKWIKKLKLVFVNLQPLTPLRGTEMYENFKKDFIIKEEEYEKWDLAHLVVKPSKISVRKYYWYTMVLYYMITVNPKSIWYMVRRYGLHDTLKLSVGGFKVNLQYFKKLIYGK